MRKKEDLLKDAVSPEIQLRDMRKKLKQVEAGARQMNEAMNSILMYLADKNGGEIRIPRDHFRITKDMAYKVSEDVAKNEYVFKIEEVKDDNISI